LQILREFGTKLITLSLLTYRLSITQLFDIAPQFFPLQVKTDKRLEWGADFHWEMVMSLVISAARLM
jgi:hypothetical protein